MLAVLQAPHHRRAHRVVGRNASRLIPTRPSCCRRFVRQRPDRSRVAERARRTNGMASGWPTPPPPPPGLKRRLAGGPAVGSSGSKLPLLPPAAPAAAADANDDDDDDPLDYGESQVLAGTFAGGSSGAKEQDEDEKRRLRILLDAFDEDQMQRYEVYRRANLNRQGVKKLINQTLSRSVGTNVAIVIGGVAKVHVGEIVERARDVQKKRGESGPLMPVHLQEAYRLYKLESDYRPRQLLRRF